MSYCVLVNAFFGFHEHFFIKTVRYFQAFEHLFNLYLSVCTYLLSKIPFIVTNSTCLSYTNSTQFS